MISYDGAPAPRLSQVRPDPDLLEEYLIQIRTAISVMAAEGVAHGDLSAYNILAAGGEKERAGAAWLKREYLDKGWLGRASGRGFYTYDS